MEAGARFVMTQPVYDPELFAAALQRVGPLRVPILMGVLPPLNLRNAEFLHNEMPGITLTEEALERMRRGGPRGGARGGHGHGPRGARGLPCIWWLAPTSCPSLTATIWPPSWCGDPPRR